MYERLYHFNLDMDLWCGIDQWPQIFAFSIYRVKARSQVFDPGFCWGMLPKKWVICIWKGTGGGNPKTGTEDLEDTIHLRSLWIMETKKMWFRTTFSCPQLEKCSKVVATVPFLEVSTMKDTVSKCVNVFFFCFIFQAVCDWVVWSILLMPMSWPKILDGRVGSVCIGSGETQKHQSQGLILWNFSWQNESVIVRWIIFNQHFSERHAWNKKTSDKYFSNLTIHWGLWQL